MATVQPGYRDHLARTAAEPRDAGLHKVILSRIDQVNSNVKLFRLQPVESENKSLRFMPGQWLDVYCPGVPKAGGFTITSSPFQLRAPSPYLELAVQTSPTNPPAVWLWRPESLIIGQILSVRVGGSFVWPPKPFDQIKRVVFIAGGVGINPLMSMASTIAEIKRARGELGFEVVFLYSTRDLGGEEILFLGRLKALFNELGSEGRLQLFLTPRKGDEDRYVADVKKSGENGAGIKRRIGEQDLFDALGPVGERADTVCYVCGVPTMTDEFVAKARDAVGMERGNVLSEKWW